MKKRKLTKFYCHQVEVPFKSFGISASSRFGSTLAIARDHGEVELWYAPENGNPKENWTIIRRISGQGVMIKGLVLRKGFLYTGGLNGLITKWDLETCCPVDQFLSFGGPVWSMAAGKANGVDVIAVACEDGKIRLFAEEDFGLKGTLIASGLDKVPQTEAIHCSKYGNKALCLCFTECGKLLCGNFSGVYCFDLTEQMSDWRVKIEGIPWSIVMLRHDIFAIGDSRGYVYFCDLKFGTILSNYRKHKFDIMSMCRNAEGSKLFTVGVDGKACMFSERQQGRWNYLSSRRISHHDLRMVECCDGFIFCGGADTSLYTVPLRCFYQQSELQETKFRSEPGHGFFDYCDQERLLIIHNNDNCLHIFEFPQVIKGDIHVGSKKKLNSFESGEFIQETSKPKEIQILRVESDGDWQIRDVCISPDGKRIAYTTLDSVVCVKRSKEKTKGIDLMKKCNVIPGHHICFLSKKICLCVSRENKVQVFNIKKKKILSENALQGNGYVIKVLVLESFVCFVEENRIQVLDKGLLLKGKSKVSWDIQHHESQIISGLKVKQNRIAVVNINKTMQVYDCDSQTLMKNYQTSDDHPISNVFYHPRVNKFLLQQSQGFFDQKKKRWTLALPFQRPLLSAFTMSKEEYCMLLQKDLSFDLPGVVKRQQFGVS